MKLQNWAIVSWLSRCCLKRACQSRTLAGQEERAMEIESLAKSLWSRKTVQENYNAICDQVASKLNGGGVRLLLEGMAETKRIFHVRQPWLNESRCVDFECMAKRSLALLASIHSKG